MRWSKAWGQLGKGLARWVVLGVALCVLSGCAGVGRLWAGLPSRPRPSTLAPGGPEFFSVGVSQDVEYFRHHVVRAQYAYLLGRNPIVWGEFKGGVQVHYAAQTWIAPVGLRWELKDGRKFIAPEIDARAFAAEFQNHMWVPLQYHRERRQRADGDADPILAVEVWEDLAILKWHVLLNRTPPSQRIPAVPYYLAKPNDFTFEEYVIAKVKGREVSSIDFNRHLEFEPRNEASK